MHTGSVKTEQIDIAVRQCLYVVVRRYGDLGCINRVSEVVVVGRAQETRAIVARKCIETTSFAVLATPAKIVVPLDAHEEAGHSRPHTDQ